MKRRNFIALSGSAALVAMVPWSFDDFTLHPYKVPKYAHPGAMVSTSPYTIVEFNKLMKKNIADDNIYCRDIEIMKAGPGVQERDIINEFYSKRNTPDALILTVAAEGDYGLDGGRFRKHLTVQGVKDLIDRTSKGQVSRMKSGEVNTDRHEWKYKAWRSGNVIVRETRHSRRNGKEFKKTVRHEIEIYNLKLFAREMVQSRVYYFSPKEVAFRKENEQKQRDLFL